MEKKKILKEIKSYALIILCVFAFRSTFFEPFRIPSGSMIPTLNIGDFILVNKFSYGFKLPYSDMFSNPVYLTQFESPKREDVIVFKYPVEPDKNFIKRVIGLPGDEVELLNKQVFINGKLMATAPDASATTKDFADNFDGIKVNFYKVDGQNKKYEIQVTNKPTQADTIARFKVPEGKYFVMGDNRDFSADSRYWGFVPKENIKGKALVVWMSLTLPILDQGLSFAPSRIGKLIF
jgi:signal peptidase I